MFKKLLEHSVTNCNGQLYCNLCMADCSSLEDALHHIDQQNHQMVKIKRNIELLTQLEINSEEDYLLVVKYKLEIRESLMCVPCQWHVHSLNHRKNASQHILKKVHVEALNNQCTKSDANESKDVKEIVDASSGIDTQREISDTFKIKGVHQDTLCKQEHISNFSKKYKNYDFITSISPICNYSEEKCEVLINNGITMIGKLLLVCTLCNKQFPCLSMSTKHLNGKRHVKNMLECSECMDFKVDLPEIKHAHQGTTMTLPQTNTETKNTNDYLEKEYQVLADNRIAILGPTYSMCVLCEILFSSQHDILPHINGRKHVNALKKHQDAEQCIRDSKDGKQVAYVKSNLDALEEKLDSSNIKNVHQDTITKLQQRTGIHQEHNLNVHKEHENSAYLTAITKLNNYSEKKRKEFEDNKIVILGSARFVCQLCKQHFPSLNNTLQHIKGKSHKEMLMRNNEKKDTAETKDISHIVTVNLKINGKNQDTAVTMPQEIDTKTHQKHNLNTSEEYKNYESLTSFNLNTFLEDERQVLSDNRIVIGSNNFMCMLCNRHNLCWNGIVGHMNGKTHIKALKEQSVQLGISFSQKQHQKNIKSLNSRGNPKKRKSASVAIKHTDQDVTVNVSQNGTDTNTCQEPSLDDSICNVNPSSKPLVYDNTSNDESNSLEYQDESLGKRESQSGMAVKHSPYYCELCCVKIDVNDIFTHINEVLHKTNVFSRNTEGDDTILFKCFCCKSIIQGSSSLINHLLTTMHLQNITNVLTHVKEGNIEVFSEDKKTFLLCNVISPAAEDVLIHFTEKPLISFDTSCVKSCNTIDSDILYHCLLCRAELGPINNLTQHCLEQVHMWKLKTLFSQCVNHTDESSISTEINKMSITNESQHPGIMQSENKNIVVSIKKSYKMIDTDFDSIVPRDVCTQIKKLLDKSPISSESIKRRKFAPKEKNLAQHLNKKYDKVYLEIEEEMYTYDRNKLLSVKSSFKLLMPHIGTNFYCLACNVCVPNELQSLYEHSRLISHMANFNKMKADPNDERWLNQYMRNLSKNIIKCYPCGNGVTNDPKMIEIHINCNAHKMKHKEFCRIIDNTFKRMFQELNTNWYSIEKFYCVICKTNFKYKLEFVEHIIVKHNKILNHLNDLMFDFCIPCATLWLGYMSTYAEHCNDIMHKYLVKTKVFTIENLPKCIEKLLMDVDNTVNILYQQTEQVLLNDKMQKEVTRSLESSLKHRFPNAKAYIFGSRVTGLGLPNSDIDIYLDCDGTYYKNKATSLSKTCFMHVEQILCSCNEEWEVKEILERTRTPIIKLRHRQMDLYCDISVTNCLSVENSKLIRSFNDAYLPCRKLILFLKKWLSLCSLPGIHGITNYALAWFVIFYLQTKSYLPSVSELIKIRNKPQRVWGWETGVARPTCKITSTECISQLLLGFFDYYAKFDYKNDIICPLMGYALTKRAFAEPNMLPKEMEPYINHLNTSTEPEYFRIDSPICVQDPFDLSHNLTKAVKSITLKCFKDYCRESASVLSSTRH